MRGILLVLFLWLMITLFGCEAIHQKWGSNNPVTICHEGRTQYLNSYAVKRWMKEHPQDRKGPCPAK